MKCDDNKHEKIFLEHWEKKIAKTIFSSEFFKKLLGNFILCKAALNV